MIILINYADNAFTAARNYNTKQAYKKGKVDKVIEFGPDDIDTDFREKHIRILNCSIGGGLWLWKPYIILKTLNSTSKGDFIIYTDAGSFLIDNVRKLINVMDRDKIDIMLFELPLCSRQFTKKETFAIMDYSNYDENQILATYIVLRNTNTAREFITQWLAFCTDERTISPLHFIDGISEFKDFVCHRHDQSVLSILARKNGIIPYRDPSQFGERPWEYARPGWHCVINCHKSSTYPKIIISNRKRNPKISKLIDSIKSVLYKLGIWNKTIYSLKNRFNR